MHNPQVTINKWRNINKLNLKVTMPEPLIKHKIAIVQKASMPKISNEKCDCAVISPRYGNTTSLFNVKEIYHLKFQRVIIPEKKTLASDFTATIGNVKREL